MSDRETHDRRLTARIARQAARRQRARSRKHLPAWLTPGLYGVVGWSIVLPTLAGIALGVWIDRTWPSRYSWTLMLLFAGVAAGCWNAWRWVALEQRAIEEDRQDDPGSGTHD